jgi:hypothetical protein
MKDFVIIGEQTKYKLLPSGKVFRWAKRRQCWNEIMGYTGTSGYLQFKVSGKVFMIHRLIAKHFVPNTELKREVNHIDGNKKNNCISNLEWVTPKENIAHAVKNGLIKSGINSKCSKILIDLNTGVFLIGFDDAAKHSGYSRHHIQQMVTGKYKNATNIVIA